MYTERMDVRIEVFDTHVLLVFPKKIDDHMTPWEQAWVLGEVLERAANDIPNPPLILTGFQIQLETEKIKFNTYKDRYVVMLFDHTDRIQLCKESAIIVARCIKRKAQDLELLNKKRIRLVYRKDGHIKQVINDRLGYTQEVRK